MHLLWLRVATILYAAASVTIFPAVLNSSERARRWCVHLGGMAFFFHFVSVVEMLVQAHRWVPVGAREAESLLGFAVAGLFFLAWWLYDAISLGVFALPITFFLVFVPALGIRGYAFPSEGVRTSWLIAHITALLAAYAALGFSLLASLLYLVQERRLKAKHKSTDDSWWIPLDWLPPLDTLERIAHAMLLFGFPCMTVGLILGAVLVQETSLGAAYFRRSQGHCLLRHVGALRPAHLSAAVCGPSRAQGGISFRRGVDRDALCLGGQHRQSRAQVRCPMSQIVLIGVNHKTAPIELRERIAISRDELADATRALAAQPGVSECMIVSTCNRVEMLAAVESPETDLTAFLHSHFGLDRAVLAPHIYEHRDQDAVRHLFRVAASLDSMVVGEPQILGQVKEAFAVARAAGTVGRPTRTPAAERLCRRQAGPHRNGDRLQLRLDRLRRRGTGAQDLRIAAGAHGFPGRRGQDERTRRAPPGPAGRGSYSGHQPHARSAHAAGRALQRPRYPLRAALRSGQPMQTS